MEYILSAVIAWLVLCIILQNREHRKTIDKLTDKIIAKDLTEYRRGTFKVPDEPKLRKAQSFYDDPSIELEEQ